MERPTISLLLYEGPNAQVFAGSLPSTGRPVAVKVLSPAQKEQANAGLTEIMTLFELKHPNIVEILGCYSNESGEGVRIALVMELILPSAKNVSLTLLEPEIIVLLVYLVHRIMHVI